MVINTPACRADYPSRSVLEKQELHLAGVWCGTQTWKIARDAEMAYGQVGLGLPEHIMCSCKSDTQLSSASRSMPLSSRGPVHRLHVLSLYCQAARGVRLARWVGRASLRVSDNHANPQMEKSLTPQAFASNNLNRSLADRRDAEFLQTSFQHAHFVVVSGSKVMVSREPAVRLRWLEAPELENLGYGPSAEGTIQHAQQGKRPGEDLL